MELVSNMSRPYLLTQIITIFRLIFWSVVSASMFPKCRRSYRKITPIVPLLKTINDTFSVFQRTVQILHRTSFRITSDYTLHCFKLIISTIVALGGLVVSVLATGPKVRGFKPGRGRCTLRVIKSVARLPSEGK
jgi:hypothetical protein